MQLGFHGIIVPGADVETDVVAAAAAGFQLVELWSHKVERFLQAHSLKEIQTLLQHYNVRPMTLNGLKCGMFQDGVLTFQEDRCHRHFEIARAVNCPSVTVLPAPAPDEKTSRETIIDQHALVLERMSEIAGTYEITLSFAFLGLGFSSIRTPRAAQTVIQKTGRNNIGIVVDATQFFLGGGSLLEIEQLDPEMIAAFHMEVPALSAQQTFADTFSSFPGSSLIPLNGICTALRKIGYSGFCSLELSWPECHKWEPVQIAVTARKVAKNMLALYFDIE